MSKELDLVPGQTERPKRFFESDEAYQQFWQTLLDDAEEELERLRESRQQSEEEAKQHWMR